MPLLTEEEFKSILPTNLKYNELVDCHVFDIIQSFNDFTDVNQGLQVVCKIGSIKLARVMINKGAYWNFGLIGACAGGHIDVVNWTIENGATAWTPGLIGACEGGHKNIARLMMEKGARNRDLFYKCFSS